MPTARITTRPAIASDLSVIKSMIREFAAYLNAIDEPEEIDDVAIERIETLAFGPEPLCRVELAQVDGEIAGYMDFFVAVDLDAFLPGLTVADLFVRDAWRGHGVGRALMEKAASIIHARGGRAVVWTVWNKNSAAQSFYRHLGAEPWHEEILMRWLPHGDH